MKRIIFFIIFGGIIISLLWLRNIRQKNSQDLVGVENISPPKMLFIPEAHEAPIDKTNHPKGVLNVIDATSIDGWKSALTNLIQINIGSPGNQNNWIMEQRAPYGGIPFIVGNSKHNEVEFDCWFLDIKAQKTNGQIQKVEMQSLWMDISETRALGDSLLSVMGKDPAAFDAWCDKVGNHWLDAPLYSSGGSHLPNSKKFYGFGTHQTFNNQKPWYILFFITDP